MAKDKPPKVKGVPNRHLHARTTFLYHAATYLTLHAEAVSSEQARNNFPNQSSPSSEPVSHGHSGLSLQLGADLQTVSRKGQVRLSAELKRSMCKTCNSILIPGHTATQNMQNDSTSAKKPWADVFVIKCTLCGSKKRFPVGAKRQKRKSERNYTSSRHTAESTDDGGQPPLPALTAPFDQGHPLS